MWRFAQRLNYRDQVLGHLDALLIMYPRKRQFAHDFPALKAKMRAHFEAGLPAAASALAIATEIIEGLLEQLTDEERRAAATALLTSDPVEFEKLVERRLGGEKDQPGDKVFFATRLCGVAILMAGKMADTGTLPRLESDRFVRAIERALGNTDERSLAEKFLPRRQ